MPHYKFSDLAYNITDKKMPEPGDEKTYIGLEHLDSGSLAVTRWGGEIELKGQKLVMKKGDILFGRRNTYLRRAAIAPHDGIFSAHGMIFRPKTEVIDPDYFPFFIASDYFMNAAIKISVGSLSPTVNWKTLKELEFDIPSLEQQRESAKILKAANELKESYQALLLKTDDLVKSEFMKVYMLTYSIIVFSATVLLAVFGAIIYSGNTKLIHSYHQTKVTDKKEYGKAFGKSVFVLSATTLLSGIVALLDDSDMIAIVAVAILVIGIGIGIGCIVAVQKKYNKGIF